VALFELHLISVVVLELIAGREIVADDLFVLLRPAGDDIIPIPGTKKYKNYDENMDSLKVKVSKEENEEIRKAISNTTVQGGRYPELFAASLFADTVPLKQQ